MNRRVLRVIRGGFLTFRCWSGPALRFRDVGFRVVIRRVRRKQ